jgi:hypothetical protein
VFNEPPYAERHVRWCEGTGKEIIFTFPLDKYFGHPGERGLYSLGTQIGYAGCRLDASSVTEVLKKRLFVILNGVKDLFFALLLRPVKSANRSFVPQDDKPFKRHFTFVLQI